MGFVQLFYVGTELKQTESASATQDGYEICNTLCL